MQSDYLFDKDVCCVEGVPIMGKKCAILDRQSTPTMMVLNLSDGGRSMIKSIDIFFHGCSRKGLDRPHNLVLEHLLCWYVIQEFTHFLKSGLREGHYRYHRTRSIVI